MSVPPFFAGLFDDAAIFPPGESPMPAALAAHLDHRRSWYADLVGPFVISDTRLAELFEAYADLSMVPTPPAVTVLASGGPTAVADLVRLRDDPRIAVVGVEAVVCDESDARRLADAVGAGFGPETLAYAELPRAADPRPLLDVLAAVGLRPKLRTGGSAAAAFPTETELAQFVHACVERKLPFKCTAGLHHAVRHVAPDTGFEHHGFLNLLLAARVAASGGGVDAVEDVLAERDGGLLADRLRPDTGRPREWPASIGTCSIGEPLDDLVRYLLVSPIQ